MGDPSPPRPKSQKHSEFKNVEGGITNTNNIEIKSLPIKRHGRYLLRLGIPLKGLQARCVCGKSNSIIHSKNCKYGGYIGRRHNSIRDHIHARAKQIFHDTELEPKLLPIGEHSLPKGANKREGARADIRINGYLRDYQNTYFDIQVINAQAPIHQKDTPKQALKNAHNNKELLYKERIESIEGGTFIPLIFTTKGARTLQTAKPISSLAARTAAKRKISTSQVMRGWSQELSFIFLKSELACVRGIRRKHQTIHPNQQHPTDSQLSSPFQG